jgi:hypothetical protein
MTPRLPKVSESVGHAVCAEMEQERGNEYIVKILERLEKENPCLAEFISRLAMRHSDPVGVSTSALLVYRLLESQIESNELAASFDVPPRPGGA